jgi:hypothetical protein
MRAPSRHYGAMHHEYVTWRQPMDIPSWQSHCFYQMNGGRPTKFVDLTGRRRTTARAAMQDSVQHSFHRRDPDEHHENSGRHASTALTWQI